MRKHRKKIRVCGFYGPGEGVMIGLIGKPYVCQVLRMYDVGVKLLNGMKSMYVNYLTCV